MLTAILPRDLAFNVIVRWIMIVAFLLALGYITKYSEDFSRRVVLTWVIATPAMLVVVTLGLHELMRRTMHDPSSARRVAFAGCNDASMALADRIAANAGLLGLSIKGFFDDRSAQRLGVEGRVRILGTLTELVEQAKLGRIDVIFLALPVRQVQRVKEMMEELRDSTVSIYYVPDVFVYDLIQARTGEILGMPVVALCETPFYGYRGVVKRITDVVFAATLLLITAPLLLAIAWMVKRTSPGPVIFKQRRYGFDGQEIVVYKFRTMTVLEDGAQVKQAQRADVRITPIGRFLRRYSLDELPQLFNVLQGRMSLVGPRPHAVAHNEEYRKLIKGYMIRHKAPPGITGLAQVNGCRGETARLEDMQARVDYDLQYLRSWSPFLDIKILFLTAVRLLRDEKAY
jgi:putative colanic acid biosynthesis UDP-glucose lipid carrier transferase